jgi:hypothetical protein
MSLEVLWGLFSGKSHFVDLQYSFFSKVINARALTLIEELWRVGSPHRLDCKLSWNNGDSVW